MKSVLSPCLALIIRLIAKCLALSQQQPLFFCSNFWRYP